MKIKNNKKYWRYTLIFTAVLGLTLVILRLTTPEDGWLCQNGEWIKHGQPSSPMPTTQCGAGYQQASLTVAQKTGDLIIYEPALKAEIGTKLHIKGEAKGGWFFEAVFPIEVVDGKDKVLATGQARATGNWQTADYVAFTADLDLKITQAGTGFIVFKKDNPSGDPAKDASFKYPIKLVK